jgi:hypothetical protein
MSKSVALILSVVAVYGFVPQRAYGDVISCSNGVDIQQYSMGSEVVYDFAYGGEVMTVSIEGGGTPMYDRITIDDQLVLEFWSRYNSQGEKVLDYSTFSFQGWTATRDGMQLTAPPQAEQVDGESQEEQVHPNVAAQAALVKYAMAQLHSDSFLGAIGNTTQEQIGSNGRLWCVLSILALVQSVQTFIAACGAPVVNTATCIWGIVYFAAAGVAVACSCSDSPEC